MRPINHSTTMPLVEYPLVARNLRVGSLPAGCRQKVCEGVPLPGQSLPAGTQKLDSQKQSSRCLSSHSPSVSLGNFGLNLPCLPNSKSIAPESVPVEVSSLFTSLGVN